VTRTVWTTDDFDFLLDTAIVPPVDGPALPPAPAIPAPRAEVAEPLPLPIWLPADPADVTTTVPAPAWRGMLAATAFGLVFWTLLLGCYVIGVRWHAS
jgi:hypothetical protein